MSVHLARAEVLLAQSRPADAEREALQALAQNPQDASAHAMLALCRVQQDRAADALEEARQAVGLAPDEAPFHRILGLVLHRLDREREALACVDEALRLDPNDTDAHVLRAVIHLALRQWIRALQSAEDALALDPEHVEAANVRAMALVRLGRKEEATLTVDHALHREPDNALSHANQGWNCLHANDPRRAKEHFREALRLDPTLDYAREGMLEALKARNPVYRLMLAYYLWIGRQSGWLQWAFILGVFFGGRVIGALHETAPRFSWLFTPLLVIFYAFIYLSWTSQPLFNLMLRLDRFGRHVLSKDQRRGSTVFGLVFFATLAALGWWLYSKLALALALTLLFAILSLCVAATWNRQGRNRWILGLATLALLVVALSSLTLTLLGNEKGYTLARGFMFGFIGFQLLAISLRGR